MQGSVSGLDTWSLPPSAPTVPLSPWKGPGNPLRGLPFPVPETFSGLRGPGAAASGDQLAKEFSLGLAPQMGDLSGISTPIPVRVKRGDPTEAGMAHRRLWFPVPFVFPFYTLKAQGGTDRPARFCRIISRLLGC